ncbi:MAG: cellulase N-terminal Ig-like domain-containing protein, partial [Planctomycetota bacterium]
MNTQLTAGPAFFLAVLLPLLMSHPLRADDEKMSIAPNGSFENDLTGINTNTCVFGGWFPIGVVTENGDSEIEIVADIARTGKKSLRVTPNPDRRTGTIYYSQYNGGEEVRQNRSGTGVSGARTLAFRLDQDILSCDASVWIKKESAQQMTLKAIWYTRRNRIPFIKITEQVVSQPIESKDGWYRYLLHALRCHSARQVQIVVGTKGAELFYIDDVEVYFNRSPHVDVLVNQVGYETQSGAKGILLQSSTKLSRTPSSFSLIDLTDSTTVFTGEWTKPTYNRQWDLYPWKGDLSAFKRPGRYVVETMIGRAAYYSPPFEIRNDLLVSRTSKPAYRFFYYQRCGMAVDSFH